MIVCAWGKQFVVNGCLGWMALVLLAWVVGVGLRYRGGGVWGEGYMGGGDVGSTRKG